jgi:hypothetical protein
MGKGRSRGSEVHLLQGMRGAIDDLRKLSRSKDLQDTLMKALDEWLSYHRQPKEQQMLAVILASMLMTQVTALQCREPGPSESEASPDEVLARWLEIWGKKYHLQPSVRLAAAGERHALTLPEALMRRKIASELRPLLNELRDWLPSWIAEQPTCEAQTTPPLAEPV